MTHLIGKELKDVERWMHAAAAEATKALCLRAKCDTVIVEDGRVIRGCSFQDRA